MPARTAALLGNEAIGRGLVEAGCHIALAYPGTPSSEVLPAVVAFARDEGVDLHANWCANEKVALETALAATYTGKRAAVIMKQVGLNVAADPLMSAAYIGVKGGLVLVVADDPGPTSSQTEQDTRQFAHFAKVPVLDPRDPAQARDMVAFAFELSERHGTPVILRPTVRVCHGRQDITFREPVVIERSADFEREPSRWAATPRHRYRLHLALNERLKAIAAEFDEERTFNVVHRGTERGLGILTGGPPAAVVLDLLEEHGLSGVVPVLEIGTPFPLPQRLVDDFVARCDEVVVLEDTDQVLELLATDRSRLRGRRDGTVPGAGELDARAIGRVLGPLLVAHGLVDAPWDTGEEASALVGALGLPGRPPTLCAGCPHRAAFFAMRKVGGKGGIYPSDIGCYTLGVNMQGVDTCHDMGAAVSMATGFYLAHSHGGGQVPPIFASLGDSTFFHAGLPPLADAVYADARFTLVVLDNQITAMTGRQPTLPSGVHADGSMGHSLSIEAACEGLQVRFVEVIDPLDVPATEAVLRRALAFNRDPDGGLAVVVARQPCVIEEPGAYPPMPVVITEACDDCGFCTDRFGCPAMIHTGETVYVDGTQCVECGVCKYICPHDAVVPPEEVE